MWGMQNEKVCEHLVISKRFISMCVVWGVKSVLLTAAVTLGHVALPWQTLPVVTRHRGRPRDRWYLVQIMDPAFGLTAEIYFNTTGQNMESSFIPAFSKSRTALRQPKFSELCMTFCSSCILGGKWVCERVNQLVELLFTLKGIWAFPKSIFSILYPTPNTDVWPDYTVHGL